MTKPTNNVEDFMSEWVDFPPFTLKDRKRMEQAINDLITQARIDELSTLYSHKDEDGGGAGIATSLETAHYHLMRQDADWITPAKAISIIDSCLESIRKQIKDRLAQLIREETKNG